MSDPTNETVNQDPTLYLHEAMFPGLELPDFAGITTKYESKHYAAIEATIELGQLIVKHLQTLRKLQFDYFKLRDDYLSTTEIKININWNSYIKSIKILMVKYDLGKKDFRKYLREIKKLKTAHHKEKTRYTEEIKTKKKTAWNKYYDDVYKVKILIGDDLLGTFKNHVKYQLTLGVSVKGQGRREATLTNISQKTGERVPEHKRSKFERLTGRNKETPVGEMKNG